MIRTVISLSEEDKTWLDRRAHQLGITMTELVRRSVALCREVTDPGDSGFTALLDQTQGLWKGVDALAHQQRSRDEWGQRG